jgi:response regulator of citrate/malate metabolism
VQEDFNLRFRAFIEDKICLIVEPSSSFSSSLQSLLSNFGVPLSQIKVCRRFEDAKQVMLEQKPKLLVTEYDLSPGLGLSLVELQESQYPSDQRIAIIVTKDSSDTTVAEAAEGAVDAFILKPFSPEALREKLDKTFERKMNPTPYQKKIQEAQLKISAEQFSEALPLLQTAKTLDEKPSLACNFAGQCYQSLGDLDKALAEFREGRAHQPLHYKCLIGEFETLMKLKKYAESYELVHLIRANYPVPMHRLAQIFTAAIFAFRFEDLPDFYELYLQMDTRAPWLSELVSVALFTGGKSWLKKNDWAQAMSFFNMAITARAREIQFIEKIVNELLKINAVSEAEEIFQKISPSDIGSPIHSQIQFRLDQRKLPAEEVMERGRKLVMDGHGNPEIYKILVEMLVKANKLTLAETIIGRAAKDDPQLQPILYALFPKT